MAGRFHDFSEHNIYYVYDILPFIYSCLYVQSFNTMQQFGMMAVTMAFTKLVSCS